MSPQEKTLTLVGKIHPTAFKDLRADRNNRPKCEDFHLLAQLLREKAVDDTLEKHIYQQQKEPKAFPKEQKLNVDMEQGVPEHQPLGKGKGKGKGLGKGRGKGKAASPVNEPEFNVKVQCKRCHRTSFYKSSCWTKEKDKR